MYYTYILKSIIKERYCIGHTSDLERRLRKHKEGDDRSTKVHKPWEVVYSEEYETKSEAMKREYCIKKMKSKKYIKELISSNK
jgi:putative endonuclease